MYGIPNDLDLSAVVGNFTGEVGVSRFGLQFSFGSVNFVVKSSAKLIRDDKVVAQWREGQWPDPAFYEIIDASVRRCDVVGPRTIEFEFETGLVMHLEDDSDQYESMVIRFEGDPSVWVI